MLISDVHWASIYLAQPCISLDTLIPTYYLTALRAFLILLR